MRLVCSISFLEACCLAVYTCVVTDASRTQEGRFNVHFDTHAVLGLIARDGLDGRVSRCGSVSLAFVR